MDEKPAREIDLDNNQPSASIVELFHMVKSLIPDGQEVVAIAPNTSVAEAVGKMKEQNFSQLPVVSGNAVLGVFSYRSLTQTLLRLGPIDTDFRSLPVDEFMERSAFIQPIDKWESILEILNREDGVLVGNRDNLQGILTSMDVLVYLHHLASPFVMLAEIELSLRRIIETCVDAEALKECAVNSLSAKYASDEMPTAPSSMTFNDYVQIIGDGRNWPYFEPAFGNGGWLRKKTVARLTEVRDLRNDTFHFKRQLDEKDYATLVQHRDWLEMKTRSFEGRKRKVEIEPVEADDEGRKRKVEIEPVEADEDQPDTSNIPINQEKSSRTAFIANCDPEAAGLFSWLLDEAASHKFIIYWGTKGFSIRAQLPDRLASFVYGYPPDKFQVYLDKNFRFEPAEEKIWRQELLAFGVLQESGAFTLRTWINPANTARLRELLTHLMDKVAALTRYPMPIQARTKKGVVTAKLLDEKGRIRFSGKEYRTASAAGKAASRGASVNGWKFWQYYDQASHEWRPIDELRIRGDER